MPKFTIKVWVKNKGTSTVSAHLGASLVCDATGQEYYNVADDIKKDFAPGDTFVIRYLNTDLGPVGKYTLYVALWEGEKAIIAGAGAVLAYLYLEKNKEKKTDISDVSIYPTEFYEE